MVDDKIKQYAEELHTVGKSEQEIITALSNLTTQTNIAQILNMNVRRVKYLYKKYGIKKYNSYRMTKRCTHCGDEVHLSWFEPVLENGKEPRYKRVCFYCQRDYYRALYMKRVISEQWEQENLKQEISIKKYELEVLESLLK